MLTLAGLKIHFVKSFSFNSSVDPQALGPLVYQKIIKNKSKV